MRPCVSRFLKRRVANRHIHYTSLLLGYTLSGFFLGSFIIPSLSRRPGKHWSKAKSGICSFIALFFKWDRLTEKSFILTRQCFLAMEYIQCLPVYLILRGPSLHNFVFSCLITSLFLSKKISKRASIVSSTTPSIIKKAVFLLVQASLQKEIDVLS